MTRATWVGAAAALCLTFCGSAAAAQGWGASSPYTPDLAVDLTLIGLSGTLALGVPVIADVPDGVSVPCGICDASSVNALDRVTTGYYSGPARTTSDVGLVSLIALPYALDLTDVLLSGDDVWDGFGVDALILTETLLLNVALNQVVKYTVQRPRPLTYNEDALLEERQEADARLSFYSGHTSTAFAMAVSYGVTYASRHPDSASRYWVYGGGLALASATGAMRILAGKHFISDVLIGAMVGSTIGVVVPWVHLGGDSPLDAESPQAGSGVSLRLTPTGISGVF